MTRVEMRVYIGGFSNGATDADLTSRLSKYGSVKGIEIPPAVVGGHRGFAFVDIDFASEADQKRLFSLSGSVWMGGKVKIDVVKKSEYKDSTCDVVDTRKQPRVRNLQRHADGNQESPDEKNLDKKRRDWWYRGKYGRPVAVMRMRKPGGSLITIDPAHYKDRFEKLFGSERPKPFSQLYWGEDYNCKVHHDSIDDPEPMEPTNTIPTVDPMDTTFPQQSLGTLNWGELYQSSKGSTFKFINEPIVKVESPLKATPTEQPAARKESQLKDLFYDLTLLKPLNIFYRNKPLEELRSEWLEQRSDLRQDFKRRMKQAKRLIRKRQKLL